MKYFEESLKREAFFDGTSSKSSSIFKEIYRNEAKLERFKLGTIYSF